MRTLLILILLTQTAQASPVIETLMMEGANQGYEGMLAIAETIRARVDSPKWPNTPEEVVLQRKQFSCWNDKKWSREFLKREETPQLIQKAMKAWHDSEYTNHRPNHYHNAKITPYWAREAKITKKIKDHIFYEL